MIFDDMTDPAQEGGMGEGTEEETSTEAAPESDTPSEEAA